MFQTIDKILPHKLGRKNKFNNEFYLNYIFRILFYGECWNTFFCDKCDRSTIRKKYYRWSDAGIFTYAHDKLFSIYRKNRTFKNLFIDSSTIENYNCTDVNFCYKIKTKKSC